MPSSGITSPFTPNAVLFTPRLVNDRGGYTAPQETKMTSSVTVPAVYGHISTVQRRQYFGKWFDLTDFDDEDEFMTPAGRCMPPRMTPSLCFRTGEGSRLSLPLNPLLSGRLSSIPAGAGRRTRCRVCGPGDYTGECATMTPLMRRIVARLKARRILLMALWRITAC